MYYFYRFLGIRLMGRAAVTIGIRLLSHSMKQWGSVADARLRGNVTKKKEHYRCDVCFQRVDGRVYKRKRRCILCLWIKRKLMTWEEFFGIA